MRNNKKKKLKLKNKFKILLFIMIFLIINFIIFFKITNDYIDHIDFSDNTLIVYLKQNNNYSCILSNSEPNIDDDNWILIKDKKCILEYKEHSNLYIKNKKKIKYSSKDDLFFDTYNIDEIYLANNDKYNYFKYIIGNTDKLKIKNDNKNIAYFDNNYNIISKNIGNTTVNIKYQNKKYITKIIISPYITKRPTEYDTKKEYLSCNKYNKEENELLDRILKAKIKNAGYKTRAGVVEAARFLTLDFPYKINYFYENGRQTTNNVDGEGRYYHVGLYLNENKYYEITGSKTGPKTWGCSLYSNPVKRYDNNGLDCSGFVSWALLNAGFDVKDVGAGFSVNSDLTDFGELKDLNKELSLSNEIRVGDLLHSYASGGHIGIIVGIDKNYYYVAQALWYDTVGVVITKYKKDKLPSSFPHVVLMDNYYKEDGNLTNMWY